MVTVREKARLEWYCRRGMLELDLLLQRFLKNGLDQLSAQQLEYFDLLLSCTDPELFAWLMGPETPKIKELKEIVFLIRNND